MAPPVPAIISVTYLLGDLEPMLLLSPGIEPLAGEGGVLFLL